MGLQYHLQALDVQTAVQEVVGAKIGTMDRGQFVDTIHA
jgi:hypothetical protein